jgi:signal transduction histidine kinase/CheY-like chemotaxis protein
MFDPETIESNGVAPRLIFTDFKIFNRSVSSADFNSVLQQDIVETDKITLSYDMSVITFEFAALSYVLPERNQYAYMLEGFDKDWNSIGTKRTATYTNLDPGKYIFRVKASNNNGVWNDKGISLSIIVTPPYWKTWWFRITIGIVILSSVYVLLLVREHTLRRQKIKLEDLVRRQTAEVIGQKNALEAQAEDMRALADAQQAQTQFLQTLNDELQKQKEEVIAKREEAETARREAEDANKAKSIFLATMSHEIRTPMNGVLGMASLLAETVLTQEQREYTNTIRSSGDALLTVINDILDFSKIESGHLELDHHAFDLHRCIEEVMDVFSVKATEKGLELLYQIDSQIPDQIITDSHRLRQVLLNLINNAIKFTHMGEIFLSIRTLVAEGDQRELEFRIKDTGIGIPKEKVSRLFKSFSQVDSSTTRKYGGTGLGLVICERLVKLMNGHITVETESGVGTTFIFTIKTQTNSTAQIPEPATAARDKTILIVDDNVTSQIILSNYLGQWKSIPLLTSSGGEALELLNGDKKIDLVVTDLFMADTNGLELAKRIKNVNPDLPVILMNAVGDETYRKYNELFVAILNKPVKKQQLHRVICKQFQANMDALASESQKPDALLSDAFAHTYPISILLAEDNPVNQKLAIRVLGKLGYHEVEVAQNGIEVIEKFNERFYDVILMDVQMPEMDGLEATRMIRLKQYHQPVIISMTANVMAEDKEACRKAGMDDYISKPIMLEALIAVLAKWGAQVQKKAHKHDTTDY